MVALKTRYDFKYSTAEKLFNKEAAPPNNISGTLSSSHGHQEYKTYNNSSHVHQKYKAYNMNIFNNYNK